MRNPQRARREQIRGTRSHNLSMYKGAFKYGGGGGKRTKGGEQKERKREKNITYRLLELIPQEKKNAHGSA